MRSTSAPKSASSMPQVGPGPIPSSSTTRIPASGSRPVLAGVARSARPSRPDGIFLLRANGVVEATGLEIAHPSSGRFCHLRGIAGLAGTDERKARLRGGRGYAGLVEPSPRCDGVAGQLELLTPEIDRPGADFRLHSADFLEAIAAGQFLPDIGKEEVDRAVGPV